MYLKGSIGIGEMAQDLRVLEDFTEGPSKVSSTHIKSPQIMCRNPFLISYLFS